MIVATFRATAPDRPDRRVSIGVALPQRARTGEWICFVTITGFLKRTGVRGEDALQALCLALELIGDTLYRARQRGVRFVYPTGERVPLHAYFRVRERQRRLTLLGGTRTG